MESIRDSLAQELVKMTEQLGSVPSPEPTQSVSSRRHSSRTTDEDPSSTSKEVFAQKLKPDTQYTSRRSTSPMSVHKAAHQNSTSQDDPLSLNSKPAQTQYLNTDTSHRNFVAETTKSNMLDDIWIRCIERCHSKTMRQLLHNYGKLVSISEVEVNAELTAMLLLSALITMLPDKRRERHCDSRLHYLGCEW